MLLSSLIIHTDGGSRGNPGPAATGIVVLDPNGTVIHQFGRFLGATTNNVAEYTAVIHALEYLLNDPTSPVRHPGKGSQSEVEVKPYLGSISFLFKLDSKLVVEQMSGHWKIKDPNLAVLAAKINNLIETSKLSNLVTFNYVPRAQNAAADAQVNLCLDLNSH